MTFGNDWNQFRSATYNGVAYEPIPGLPEPASTPPDFTGATAPLPPKPLMVDQSIGIYPDASSADHAFERLIPELIGCSALHAKHYDFAVIRLDDSTVELNYGALSNTVYHLKSTALIQVSIFGFPENERIAQTIVQDISTRIE